MERVERCKHLFSFEPERNAWANGFSHSLAFEFSPIFFFFTLRTRRQGKTPPNWTHPFERWPSTSKHHRSEAAAARYPSSIHREAPRPYGPISTLPLASASIYSKTTEPEPIIITIPVHFEGKFCYFFAFFFAFENHFANEHFLAQNAFNIFLAVIIKLGNWALDGTLKGNKRQMMENKCAHHSIRILSGFGGEIFGGRERKIVKSFFCCFNERIHIFFLHFIERIT